MGRAVTVVRATRLQDDANRFSSTLGLAKLLGALLVALNATSGCVHSDANPPPIVAAAPVGDQGGSQHVSITVSEEGFSPSHIRVRRGEPVTFVFTRRTDHTCAKDVVIYLDDVNVVRRELPLNQPVEITVTFPQSGERGFACSMKMRGAAVLVE